MNHSVLRSDQRHSTDLNDQIRTIYQDVSRIAPTRASVLITGETGIGKEGFARRKHAESGRKPFIIVDCG